MIAKMIAKKLFRFGLPLGSGTVLSAILEFALASYWFVHGVGAFIHYHMVEDGAEIESKDAIRVGVVSLKLLLALGLWGFVLLSHRTILLIWLPLSVISDILLVVYSLMNYTSRDSSEELWFLSISVIILVRLYIFCVFYQALFRLIRNARIEAAMKQEQYMNVEMKVKEHGVSNGIQTSEEPESPSSQDAKYDIIVLDDRTMAANSTSKNSVPSRQIDGGIKGERFQLIEPIGGRAIDIWWYYCETPRLGAAVLVMFELIWNIFILISSPFTKVVLRGDIFLMVRAEEMYMRVWRVLLNVIAAIFIFNNKKTLLRFWLILYLWTLFFSVCIFTYILGFEWITPATIQVIAYFVMFFADNCVRFGIVFFVLRATILPPVVSQTSPTYDSKGIRNAVGVVRSQSLMSQKGSSRMKKRQEAVTVKNQDSVEIEALAVPLSEG